MKINNIVKGYNYRENKANVILMLSQTYSKTSLLVHNDIMT